MTTAPLPAHVAARPLCPYCRQPIDDVARHAGQCPVLFMALDTEAWPEGDAVSRRNRANVAKRRDRVTRKGGYWVHGRKAARKMER